MFVRLFQGYFSEIIKSGYSLQNLKKEPQRLREAREENLSQTQNLAFENYKTFIQTADCSRDVFSEFGNVESKLDSLLDELPSGLYKASRTLVEFLKKLSESNDYRSYSSISRLVNLTFSEIKVKGNCSREFFNNFTNVRLQMRLTLY